MIDALAALLVFCAVFAIVGEPIVRYLHWRSEQHADDWMGENGSRW